MCGKYRHWRDKLRGNEDFIMAEKQEKETKSRRCCGECAEWVYEYTDCFGISEGRCEEKSVAYAWDIPCYKFTWPKVVEHKPR